MTAPIAEIQIYPGCTLLIPSGPSGNHLFVSVLAEKVINGKPHVLLVSLCTIDGKPNYDQTCVVKAGEHSFAKDDSYINFAKPRSEPVADVLAQLKNGYFLPKNENVSAAILMRIQAGLKTSNRIPRYIKDDWQI